MQYSIYNQNKFVLQSHKNVLQAPVLHYFRSTLLPESCKR